MSLEDECPTCQQRVLTRHGVKLSPKLADIFDAVERAGSAGIDKNELAIMFYGNSAHKKGMNTLKVSLNHINKAFAWMESPIRVISLGHKMPYRVVNLEDEKKEGFAGARPSELNSMPNIQTLDDEHLNPVNRIPPSS